VTGTITVHDSRDNGIADSWGSKLTGRRLRHHESRTSVCLIDTDTASEAPEFVSHPPYKRTYWSSRR
jgi:hypothetical protein